MSAILVLNGGYNEFGEANLDTAARIEAGIHLAELKPAAQLIMVGGESATLMRDFVAGQHPEIEPPFAERKSRDTVEGAHYAKLDYLEPGGHRQVDVVTSDFHGPRTAWTFAKVLGPAYEVSLHLVPTNHSQLLRHKEHLQFAVAKLKLAGVGPEDDSKRAQRLPHFRFRSSNHPFANLLELLEMVDSNLNARLKRS